MRVIFKTEHSNEIGRITQIIGAEVRKQNVRINLSVIAVKTTILDIVLPELTYF